MAFFNYAKKELSAKIVFYGPGLSGKTTNLEVIHRRMRPDQRGKLISLDTQTDRTLFFDFLPLELGEIRGFKTRFHIYTVPGQVFYNATRKVVLKGVDGIVFVADTQRDMLDSNLMSFKNLEANLDEQGRHLKDIPHVLQYNKRDLPDVSTIEELQKAVNRHRMPYFEAAAISETGVLETLTAICKLVLKDLKDTHEGPAKKAVPRKASTPGIQPAAAAPGPPPPPPRPPRVPFGAPPPPPPVRAGAGREAAPATAPPEMRKPPAPFVPPPRPAPPQPVSNPMLEDITYQDRTREHVEEPPVRPAQIPLAPAAEDDLEIVEGLEVEEAGDVVFIEEEEGGLEVESAPEDLGGAVPSGAPEEAEPIDTLEAEPRLAEEDEEAGETIGLVGEAPAPESEIQAEAEEEEGEEFIAVEEPEEDQTGAGAALVGEPLAEGDEQDRFVAQAESAPPFPVEAREREEAPPPEPAAPEPPSATSSSPEPESYPRAWGEAPRFEISGWGQPARVSSSTIRIPIRLTVLGDPAHKVDLEIVIDVRTPPRGPGAIEGGTKH